ncbi:tetratricopeptide repeat protein [Aquimarina mytili]|uniref:Tetratricopeptide repeat protein n=1 Tax=Aquimarina mytili TaxID=874423 RepID=A0A937A0I7_9FLAO|nr:tetratricopeptide repeat protein [Aquimarina mytili]MBL0685358.1 tetratricopeptide repeat protein [Aquimarina mytili]
MNTKKTISLLALIFIGVFINSSHAQVVTDTLLASQYFKKGDSLLIEGKYKSSIESFEKALPIYEKATAWEKVASCYNKISYAYRKKGDNLEKVFENANEALKISKRYLPKNDNEKACAYDNTGYYHQDKYDFDTALNYFEKALSLRSKIFPENHQNIALSLENIGFLKYDQGNYIESLEYHRKALLIRKQVHGEYHSSTSKSYHQIGIAYSRLGKYKKAIEQYEKAIEIGLKVYGEYHSKISSIYEDLGYAHMYGSEYREAETYLKKALIIGVKIDGENKAYVAGIYYTLADLYRRLGKLELSIINFEKALIIYTKTLGETAINVSNTYYSTGLVFEHKGHYEKAFEYYKKALTIFLEKKSTHPTVSIIYSGIGNTLLGKGAYQKALQYFNEGLDVALQSVGERHVITGVINYNIALAYKELKDYDKALSYNKKSLGIKLSNYGDNHPRIALSYNQIGDISRARKQYNEALQFYKNALKIYSIKFDDAHFEVAESLEKIGALKQEMGLYDEALDYFKKSLEIRKKVFSENSSFVAQSYINIAEIFLIQKDYQKALVQYEKALKANIFLNTKDQYFDKKIFLTTLQGQANTHKKLYQQSKSITDFNKAIAIYQKADTLINTIRQSFTNYQDKVSFAKQAKEVYQGAIEAQLLLYEIENNQKTLTKAFYYTERSKANTLKELLNDANAKNFTGLPTDLVALEKDLRINKAFYQSKLTQEHSEKDGDSSKITRYENKLFEINRRQDSLTEVLEKNYPKYYQLKHKNDVVSVGELQQQLNEQTTVVEFFTSDSITYAFTITKNKIAVEELTTTDLTKKIETFREAITSKHVGDFKTSAHQLYQELIAPIVDHFVGDELIIIPDGPLWHLNFELLLTQQEEANNPVDFSYLLHNYAISYANAANILFSGSQDTPTSKKQEECLAFSFTDSTNIVDATSMSLATLRDAGDDLPGTRKEIKAIAEIIDGQYYFGSEAIEANFKKNANQYNILHLALHGEVDNERPENSKLYFTKTKDTIEDNLLYGHELFALDIPAELTVLSACNTGSGKIAKGEGIMSLGTAFQYAGTKSLLLTSWEVSDQTTPALMKYFYTNLKQGMSKSKALQQAKLDYLKTADINRTHPFYWGGFYLVGDTAPIPFSDHTWWYWVIGLLGVLLLWVFWYRKRRKHNS